MENHTAEEYTYYDSEKETLEKIDLFKIIINTWKGIRAWWWAPVLLAIVAGLFRFITIDRSYVPYYQTSATVYVSMTSGGSMYKNVVNTQQMATVFPYLYSDGVLRDAIKAELGTDKIEGSVTLSAKPSTNLLTFQVTGREPEKIHELLEAVIEVFPETLAYIVGPTEFTVFRDMGIPTSPANTKPTQMTYIKSSVKAALAAFVFGLILVGLYGVSVHTISSVEETKQYLNAVNLGVLPSVSFKKRSNKQRNQLTIDNSRIPFNFEESLRSVRTRFERITEKNGGRTVLVTSTVSGEGKTTVAVNLALSLAQKGCKILLIDGDMRHPSVASILRMDSSGGGLCEVLNGELTVTKAITRLPGSGLYVMTAGSVTDKSTDLLSSNAMKKLLEQVHDYADYIIVDTPPVMMLSDSIALGKYVDGFVYVVRCDRARRHMIMEGFSQIAESGCRAFGTVLNGDVNGTTGYGSRYGKYSGYGKYGSYHKYSSYGKYGAYGKKAQYGSNRKE